MGVGILEAKRLSGEQVPVEIVGIKDDRRTGAPGAATILSYTPQRVRQLAPLGVVWIQRTADALGVEGDEKQRRTEMERRLLNNDPSVVDEDGELHGVAQQIQESLPTAQRYPLIGKKASERGWVFDTRFLRLFLQHDRPLRGNPLYSATPLVLRLLSDGAPTPMSVVSEMVAAAVRMTPGDVGRLLGRLMAKGVVEKGDDEDGIACLTLTPEGIEQARRAAPRDEGD